MLILANLAKLCMEDCGMTTVSMFEAKTNLSRYVASVNASSFSRQEFRELSGKMHLSGISLQLKITCFFLFWPVPV
jgi:hypothetical protein